MTVNRILLIDDDHDIRVFLAAVLRHAGFEVTTAADGRHGVALFRQHPFDLVITDLVMPAQNGYETIKAIQRLHPGFKIIAISGGDQVVAARYLKGVATRLGLARVLTKPFSDAQLVEAVNDVLHESQPPMRSVAAVVR